jgi:hypothetical protein
VRRQRSKDLAMGWGQHYSWSREKLKTVWDELEARLVDVTRLDLEPSMTHPGPRWWASLQRSREDSRGPLGGDRAP